LHEFLWQRERKFDTGISGTNGLFITTRFLGKRSFAAMAQIQPMSRGTNASWIYLFHLDGDHFSAERLVNMKRHHYQLEPNVHFSPDGKWIIFRSNMFSPTNVFAVKL
jgi:oligogalacturonide lyase